MPPETTRTFFMSIIDQSILHRLLRKEYSRLIDFARRLERKELRKLAWAQLDRAQEIGNLITNWARGDLIR
jgi:hypothetical protein